MPKASIPELRGRDLGIVSHLYYAPDILATLR